MPAKRPDINHLTPRMQAFFKRITSRYRLLDHHLAVLAATCEAHDRMQQATALLTKDGLTITTRHGEVRSHPAAAIERDSRTAFWRGLRELGLSDEDAEGVPRPPRPQGRYRGRP
jgi:P27 family predicted phage terminase small subunit